MAQSTVSELLKKVRTQRTMQDLPKPGAPRKIQGKALQYIVAGALRGKFNSAADIRQYLLLEEGIDVSDECVLETLRREGIDSKRLTWLREPTDNQRERRVAFAREYRGSEFRKWVFTDETGLHRQERGRQKRKFVPHGTPAPALATERELTGGGGKVNLWVAMCPDGIFAWRIYRTNLTASRYQAILKTELLPAAKARYKQQQWIFQQDGATPHTAKTTKHWLQTQSQAARFTAVKWPANSPDLSPIENFWLELKDDLSRQGVSPGIPDLEARVQAAIEMFNRDRKDLFEHYYDSMQKRLDLVIKRAGKRTGY